MKEVIFHKLHVSNVSDEKELSFNFFPSLHLQRRQWHPTPVLLLGKSHGPRSLLGCNPWGCSELDTTEQLHFHFSLSCIGEGNGSPLQCACLENPRDGGAWKAAIYGVAQSRTWLKWLSSSSSRHVESSQTRDRTHVPSIGRQILNHWTPEKAL